MADKTSKNKSSLDIWPTLDIEVKTDADIEKNVDSLLSQMTLKQKIAQMIQPEIREFTVEDMREYGFGSYLNGGGSFPNGDKHASVEDWISLAERMYQASIDDSIDSIRIPTMWGTDAVHGHNNVLGATLFPHNIGLGATNNPKLIEQIAKITATEVLVTGIEWIFAPTVATARDDRWGRTYESYSESPTIVKQYSAAIVRGLQGQPNKRFLTDNHVISTVKHFIGDGGTVEGIDQGNNIVSEQELFDTHGQGYVGGLTAGAQSVMASFNSWHGNKLHGDDYLLSTVLKQKMGFDGFVVGDWNGHGQVAGCSNDSCAKAINAGIDIVMVPSDWKALYHNTLKQVEQGIIPHTRIDDAVKRILRVKFRAGLFTKANPANRPLSGKTELLGAQTHRNLARQAVRESLVLLKNNDQLLPLNPNSKILVAGDAAHNIGKQSGGWSVTWQGTNNTNDDFPGATSIYQGLTNQVNQAGGQIELSESGEYLHKPDYAIVVFGEEPYAEGDGDIDDLEYQKGDKSDLALLKKLRAEGIPTVAIFISGRPLWVNAEINTSDAFVAAWLPGSEGAGIADVLLSKPTGEIQFDFTGKLSFSWPAHPNHTVNVGDKDYDPQFAFGYGLTYQDSTFIPNNLKETYKRTNLTSNTFNIHKSKLRKPWQMTLISGSELLPISSSSHALDRLRYRTIDKYIQEDAFRLVSEGNKGEDQGVGFYHPTISAVDLLNTTKTLYLSVDLRLNQPLADELTLSIKCKDQDKLECNHQYSLNLITTTSTNWQTLYFDTSCIKSGTDDSHLKIELTGKGPFEIDIANLVLTTDKPVGLTAGCIE